MSEQPKPAWLLRRWVWALTGGVNQNLLSAAALGQTRKAMRLLDSSAHIEFRDRDGWTALMFAAGGGHSATVAALLARGADPKARSNDGATALKTAIDLHRATVVTILQNAGCTPPPLFSIAPVRSSGVPPPLPSSPAEIRRDPALDKLIQGLEEYDVTLQALVRGLESGHDRAALNFQLQKLATLDLGRMLISGGIFEITDQPSLARLKEILTKINTGAKAAERQLEGGARAPTSLQDIVNSASAATSRGGNYPVALQVAVPNILMVTQSSLSHVEKSLSMSPTRTPPPSG